MSDPTSEAGAGDKNGAVDTDRRAFLMTYGKVALVAPPVITTMLATSMSSAAIAQSSGGRGNGSDAWLLGAGALPLAAAIPGRAAPAALAAAPLAPPPVVAAQPLAPPPPPPPTTEEYYKAGERG